MNMTDALGRLERTSRLFQGAMAVEGRGADDDGIVEVVIDQRGVVTQVVINWGWRQICSADDFGGKVMEAWAAAQQARVLAFFNAAGGDPDAQDAALARAPRPAAADTAVRPPGGARPGALNEAIASVGGLAGAVDELMHSAQERARQRQVLSFQQGQITVTVDWLGQIVGCEVASAWAKSVSPDALADAVRAALSEAGERGLNRDPLAVLRGTRLGKVMELIGATTPHHGEEQS